MRVMRLVRMEGNPSIAVACRLVVFTPASSSVFGICCLIWSTRPARPDLTRHRKTSPDVGNFANIASPHFYTLWERILVRPGSCTALHVFDNC